MVLLLATLIVAQVVIMLPAGIYSRRRGRLFPGDYTLPVLPLAIWSLLTWLGIGAQSLANIIELPLVSMAVILLYYGRVFVLDRCLNQYRTASVVVVMLSILVPVILRLSMPLLPE